MTTQLEMPMPGDSASGSLEKTPVVFASNAGFFEGLAVAVSSALMSHSGPGLGIRVLDGGLAPQQRNRLQSIVRRFGPSSDLRFVPLAEISTPDAPLPSIRPLPYARLWMDLALPGCDRAVYIDSDILVRRDPMEIFSHISPSCAVAACIQPHMSLARDPLVSSGPGDDLVPYFDTGVMGVNLRYCRENGTLAEARRLCLANCDHCTHYDQTILNHTLRGKVTALPSALNFTVEFDSPPSRTRPHGNETPNLHFIGETKPWAFFSLHEDFRLWRRFYAGAVRPVPAYMLHWRFWSKPVWAWLVRRPWLQAIAQRHRSS